MHARMCGDTRSAGNMLKESRSRDVYCRGVWWDSDQYRERRGVTSTPILLADVASRLVLSLPVITCFRCFLGAHGSEGATAAMEAGRRHVHAAWRRTQKPRRMRKHSSVSWLLRPPVAACSTTAAAAARPRSARACRGCPGPGRHCRRHHHRRPQPGQPAAEACDCNASGSAAVSRRPLLVPGA